MAPPSVHGARTTNAAESAVVCSAAAVSTGAAGATVDDVVVVGRGSVAGLNVLPSPVSHATTAIAIVATVASAINADDVADPRGMAQERTDSLALVFDGMSDRPVLLTVHAHPDDE